MYIDVHYIFLRVLKTEYPIESVLKTLQLRGSCTNNNNFAPKQVRHLLFFLPPNFLIIIYRYFIIFSYLAIGTSEYIM